MPRRRGLKLCQEAHIQLWVIGGMPQLREVGLLREMPRIFRFVPRRWFELCQETHIQLWVIRGMPQLWEVSLLRDVPRIRVPGGEAMLQQANTVRPAVLPSADLSLSGAARLRARGKVHPKPAAKADLQSASPEDKVEDMRSGDEWRKLLTLATLP